MTKERIRFIASWTLVLSYMGLLFFLSSRPSLPLPDVEFNDKIAHFLAYALMGLFLGNAVSRTTKHLEVWEQVVVSIVLASMYGALDEYHQSFVPGRTPSVADFVADSLGATAGAWAWASGKTRKKLS